MHGMAQAQRVTFMWVIEHLNGVVGANLDHVDKYFHHGDCVGSDEEMHMITLAAAFKIIIHPPKDPKLRAFCKHAFITRPEEDYLKRTTQIVRESDYMIFTPRQNSEILRSGTWTAVRRANTHRVPYSIILPDGAIQREVFS